MVDDAERRHCVHCRRPLPAWLHRCRRRNCPGYAHLWAGDQRRKLFVNLGHYADALAADVKRAAVLLGSVTAPGVDVLPWDEAHCAALGKHKHSGTLGCRVRWTEAQRWNRDAPSRWSRLHSAVMVRCRREGVKPWLLTRVWEMQHRGVLHVHPVLAFSSAAEKRAARTYLRHLAELAPAHGFGFTERKLKVLNARAAAAYLSAYFVTGSKHKRKVQLHESVMSGHMPRSIVHVSTRLTRPTGCTMRRLRMLRFCHVRGFRPLTVGESYHRLDEFVATDRGPVKRAWIEANAPPQ